MSYFSELKMNCIEINAQTYELQNIHLPFVECPLQQGANINFVRGGRYSTKVQCFICHCSGVMHSETCA